MKIAPETKFLHDENVRLLMQILNGHEQDSTRFVGGAVRDALLGRVIQDIDIATKLHPDIVANLLSQNQIRFVPTGIEHGTISAILGGRAFEITTLRKDVATDGRRAVVEYTNDFYEDALRRDFTINALYCDENGVILDPLGQGVDDINAHILRFAGAARARIAEDYLRILRFFRFYAKLGNFTIDLDGLRACEELCEGIKTLSRERVWMELKKILGAPAPLATLNLMDEYDCLQMVLPFEYQLENLVCLAELEETHDFTLRLMAILPKTFRVVDELAHNMRFSNAEKKRFTEWAKFEGIITAQNIRANIYYYGNQAVYDNLISQYIADGVEIANLINIAKNFTAPKFPINGDDLKSTGFKDGPEIGKKLKELEKHWIKSGFTMTKDELLAF
jgi:tRNA nucleotidyltransferase/poly(A) polymerase